MFKQNQLGGTFQNGKPTPDIVKQRIINKYAQGIAISKMSKDLQITERGVRKVVSTFEETGQIDPKLHIGRAHYKTTDNVLQHIDNRHFHNGDQTCYGELRYYSTII